MEMLLWKSLDGQVIKHLQTKINAQLVAGVNGLEFRNGPPSMGFYLAGGFFDGVTPAMMADRLNRLMDRPEYAGLFLEIRSLGFTFRPDDFIIRASDDLVHPFIN